MAAQWFKISVWYTCRLTLENRAKATFTELVVYKPLNVLKALHVHFPHRACSDCKFP